MARGYGFTPSASYLRQGAGQSPLTRNPTAAQQASQSQAIQQKWAANVARNPAPTSRAANPWRPGVPGYFPGRQMGPREIYEERQRALQASRPQPGRQPVDPGIADQRRQEGELEAWQRGGYDAVNRQTPAYVDYGPGNPGVQKPQYGTWIGKPAGERRIQDFRDSDGDGFDDRTQAGPGQRPPNMPAPRPGTAQPVQPPSQGTQYNSPGPVSKTQQWTASPYYPESLRANPNTWTDAQWNEYKESLRNKPQDTANLYRYDGKVYLGGGMPVPGRDNSPTLILPDGGQPQGPGTAQPTQPPSPGTPYNPGQPSVGGWPDDGGRKDRGLKIDQDRQRAMQDSRSRGATGDEFRQGQPGGWGSQTGGFPNVQFPTQGQGMDPLQQMWQQSMNAWAMPKQQLLGWGQQMQQMPWGPNYANTPDSRPSPWSQQVTGMFGNNQQDMWNNIGGFIQGVNSQAAQKPVGVYQGQGNPGPQYGKQTYDIRSLINQGNQMVQGGWQNPFMQYGSG